jgi:tight adherence protein C
MLLIGMLMLVACTGGVYAAYLFKKEKESQARRVIQALEEDRSAVAARPAGAARRLVSPTSLANYEQKLLWAGRPYGLEAGQFVGLKVTLAVLLPVALPVLTLFQLGSMTLPVMLLSAVVGFTLPDLWLSARLNQRKQVVAEELPLFADLIATAVSAGLPLTEAVRRVAADVPGLVAREFLRAVQEMAAGKPRAQAWRDLTNRVPGDELRVIVSAIMQAEQYGTSVAEIIRYQVQQIRLFKQQEAQRIAQTVTVKMRIPILALEMPPMLSCC